VNEHHRLGYLLTLMQLRCYHHSFNDITTCG
jgi:hypothetical protein